ncbi:hypothetical protein [Hymenobacter sp. B1770]|uniref:hypothetical protein n=1 Tax=Hymenobacter sp. B1770 TaxID=1718788 RepID=UPI003CE6D976
MHGWTLAVRYLVAVHPTAYSSSNILCQLLIMPYRHVIRHHTYTFADLKSLLARASPLRSGDVLAGVRYLRPGPEPPGVFAAPGLGPPVG